jgi:putative aldouronate transport system permease protein
MSKMKIKEAVNDRIFSAINYSVLSLAFLVVLYPLLFILSSSLSSGDAVISGRVWLFPVEINLEGYTAVFRNKNIGIGYGNSAIYMVAGTVINVLMTILAAYPLSRKDLFGRNFYMALFTFTMLFNGGLIPTYLLIKNLGMLNTRWAMLIPNALLVYNVIVTRTYFQTSIPQELLEAAKMDGCRDYKFILRVVLPLSGPIIAVISLWYAVGHWNTYFSALIYLKSTRLYPLQLFLRSILLRATLLSADLFEESADEDLTGLLEVLRFSLIIVASLPVLAIYPLVQRYFIRGVMIGALKG